MIIAAAAFVGTHFLLSHPLRRPLVSRIGEERLQPGTWPAWERRTSYWPFAAIVAGRARFGGFGTHALVGGLVVWLAATWAHIPLAGWPAGIWRWL